MFLALATGAAHAQDSPVRLQGNLSLGGEMYSSQGIDPRRPRSTYRAVLTPTLTIYDQIQLPFEIYYTSEDRGFRQPFNQFGVSPHLWGWLTLHAGFFSTRFSEFTFGDGRLLGGGVEINKGSFRFGFVIGRSQQAVAADSAQGFRGAYRRTQYAARIGFGPETGAYINLNLAHAADDAGSLQNAPPENAPKENAVASLTYGFPIGGEVFKLSGEAAVSAFTNDTGSEELEGYSGFLSRFFTARYSSQIDGATALALTVTPSSVFSFRLNGRWVGPGFVTLGYPQLTNDVLEATFAPMLRLFTGRLNLRGSVGLRTNNLRNTRISTTRRTIWMLMLNGQPTPELGVDVQYSNYGMRSNPQNDTLKIDNISQSLTIAPRYTFPAFGGTSTAVLTYSYQDFTDYNTVTGALSDNRTQAGTALYMLAFPSSLSLTTALMLTSSETSQSSLIIQSLNQTIGYSFLDNALTTSATIGYTITRSPAKDGQFVGRLSASYSLGKAGSFTLSLTTNRYTYSDAAGVPSYREAMGSLIYGLSF
jgi:hypothetical protein